MPPKAPPSSGSNNNTGGKQTSLLGFFNKRNTTTTSTATTNASGSGSGSATSSARASTSTDTNTKPTTPRIAPSSQFAYSDTQSKSKSPLTGSSPAASSSTAVGSGLGLASSPLTGKGNGGGQNVREGINSTGSSPLTIQDDDEDDEDMEEEEVPLKNNFKPTVSTKIIKTSQPLATQTTDIGDTSMSIDPISASTNDIQDLDADDDGGIQDKEDQDGDGDDDDDDQPIRRRSSKRKKISYAESGTGSGSDSESPVKKASRLSNGAKGKGLGQKKKGTKGKGDEDDYEFDGGEGSEFGGGGGESASGVGEGDDMDEDFGEWDEEALADAMSEFENPKSKKTKPKPKSKFNPPAATASKPTRPPVKPLPESSSNGGAGGGGSGTGNGSGGMFLTQAEKNRLEKKEAKAAEENVFDFLKEENIKDMDRNRPGDPNYDPRTLFIPRKAWDEFTPFETQFWQIKQTHMDVVLFFQKGKFYELYEDDADIGHREFDLKLTGRVKMRMVGVPESSFDFWAAKFLAGGYKVGKVEQAETQLAKEMRGKNNAKGVDKIVRRELASVLTNGTVVDSAFLSGDEASHCLAIKESVNEEGLSSFGVCILDAPTGKFELTFFDDDVCFTRLETLMRQLKPKEIIHEKGNLSASAMQLLKTVVPYNTCWVPLKAGTEFFDSETTKTQLEDFFGADVEMADPDDATAAASGIPQAILDMLEKDLAIESLGGMIFYLRSLNIDKDLLSQRSFDIYDPIRKGQFLVLDGQTLSHLEILINNEGGVDGTLLQLLERCITPFGKRLFRIWLTVPLTDVAAINARLDAVQDLMNHPTFATHFVNTVKKMPDMERAISRIHAGKCKKSDFLKVVDSFRRLRGGCEEMLRACSGFDSTSIETLLKTMPDIKPMLKQIESMFVEENGEIVPRPGASEACDAALADIYRIEEELESVFEDIKSRFKNGSKFQWWHSSLGNKEVYNVAVPAGTKVPSSWIKNGNTKAHDRYMPSEVKDLAREIQEARETQGMAFRDFYGELLGAFDQERETWLKAIRVIAELDCLLSLAKSSAGLDEPKCRPELVDADQAFFEFGELRHPALCLRSDFVSNDVQLGGRFPRQTLLTGPNTAGKSTICRQTAIAVIMSQMGCFVPASSARISPIDRIQTRMGAYDNMFSNSSTFRVELDEAGKMLREAGPKSFIILDELGRGTSTFDGSAIATAVLHQIATHSLPLGFFATHYGSLTDDFRYHPNIRLMHMKTQVDDERREVICLYKLIAGKAKSSYGTHIAHLAGLPDEVVTRAEQISKEFSADFKQKQMVKRRSDLSVLAQADFAWLVKLAAAANKIDPTATFKSELAIIHEAIPRYSGV